MIKKKKRTKRVASVAVQNAEQRKKLNDGKYNKSNNVLQMKAKRMR